MKNPVESCVTPDKLDSLFTLFLSGKSAVSSECCHFFRVSRRGLGRQLLKAAEEVAVMMGAQDLYLHCRMVDLAPLEMYKGAGYQIVATDSLLSLLTLQRRRYLMRKRLPELSIESSNGR